MTDDHSGPVEKAPQLQEAIDVVVQVFDYPPDLSIRYNGSESTKRTRFEVDTGDGTSTYELRYDGRDEDADPELVPLE